ncbi:MAG: mandelate racemase/muconate lactonizing enzyme family protein [Actinomycetota bacterium]
MRIESVELFYLRMPEVFDIGDGSQDALIFRVRAGGHEGWGEAPVSPLTSIASWIAPMSHSGCHPVIDSVLGEKLDSAADIARIAKKVRSISFYGIIQSDLTFSGVEIAMWDLLGKAKEVPVYTLLGYTKSERKLPYASVLFGETSDETFQKAEAMKREGFSAIKFGWGPYGRESVEIDSSHVRAAREGIGADAHLMIDAGTIFNEDVEAAAKRLQVLSDAKAMWFEEPVDAAAVNLYKQLSQRSPKVALAGGEGAHNAMQAEDLIDNGGIGFVQIDTGYVGGIGSAFRVAKHAQSKGVQYVNHTFTSHSALSASLQPFAGMKGSWIAEYPMEPKLLCQELNTNQISIDADGMISAPESPGLGIEFNIEAMKKYLVDVEIKVNKKVLYQTPTF